MTLARFTPAYKRTKGHEGFYSSGTGATKDDPGGETVLGLTRKDDPDWKGWPLVDNWKTQGGFPDNMKSDPLIYSLAAAYYEAKYWLSMGCDKISSQVIANKLFDVGVNIGDKTLALFLQYILNCFSKNGSLWAMLPVDGDVGAITVSTMKAMLSISNGEKTLYRTLDAAQQVYYMIGRDAFKALAQALRSNPPPIWRSTFNWGWEENRTEDYEQALREALEDSGVED